MRRKLRSVFWIEAVLAVFIAPLGTLTIIQPDWIERIFLHDPDNHSGALEWKLVIALFLTAVWLSVLAVRNWRRAPQAS